jgi:hypothetical protein
MKAATLYKTDGTQESVLPGVKKSKFVLEEMRKFVQGPVGMIHVRNGECLIVNENGINQELPPNHEATNLLIAKLGPSLAAKVTGGQPLVGNVLHCRVSQVD